MSEDTQDDEDKGFDRSKLSLIEHHFGPQHLTVSCIALLPFLNPKELLKFIQHLKDRNCENYCLANLLLVAIPRAISNALWFVVGASLLHHPLRAASIAAFSLLLWCFARVQGKYYLMLRLSERQYQEVRVHRKLQMDKLKKGFGGIGDLLDFLKTSGAGVEIEVLGATAIPRSDESEVDRLIRESQEEYAKKQAEERRRKGNGGLPS